MSKAFTASRISGNCGMRSSGDVRPVRLVLRIEIGAEGLFRLVEHHREMGRLLLRLHVVEQLPQHVAEAEHGVDLQARPTCGSAAAARDRRGRCSPSRRPGRRGRPSSASRPMRRACGFGRRGFAAAGLAAADLDLLGAGMARMWAVAGPESMRDGASVNHSAGCIAGARAGLQLRPGRPLEQEAERRAAHRPVPAQRADHARGRHDQRDRAEVGDDAGLEQRRCGSPPSAGRRRDR